MFSYFLACLFISPILLMIEYCMLYVITQGTQRCVYCIVYSNLKSDWVVTVNSEARAFNYTRDIFFSYVDATITLKKDTDNIIFQGKLSQKGGSTIDYKKASRKATNPLCKSIGDQLITEMKK